MKRSIAGLLAITSLFIGVPLAHSQTSADYTSQYLPKVLSLSMLAPHYGFDAQGNLNSISSQVTLSAKIHRNAISYFELLMTNSTPTAPASTNVVCQNFISLWGGDPLGAQNGVAIPIQSRSASGDWYVEKSVFNVYVSNTNVAPCAGKYILSGISMYDVAGRDLTVALAAPSDKKAISLQYSTLWTDLGPKNPFVPCVEAPYANLNPAPVVRTLCDQNLTWQTVGLTYVKNQAQTVPLPTIVDYQPQLVAALLQLTATQILYKAEVALLAKTNTSYTALQSKLALICATTPKPAHC